MKRFAFAITALVLVGVVWVASTTASVSDPTLGLVPADLVIAPLSDPSGTISRSAALDVASKEAEVDSATKVSASLVLLTDPNTLRGDAAIKDRAIWLVHLEGLSHPVSVPFGASLKGNQTVSNGYVYIDAYTGEWLMSRYEN